MNTTTKALQDADIVPHNPLYNAVINIASHLLRDSPCWPLEASRYFVGLIPKLPVSTVMDSEGRALVRIFQSWHWISIKLAGRILGSVQRRDLADQQELRRS